MGLVLILGQDLANNNINMDKWVKSSAGSRNSNATKTQRTARDDKGKRKEMEEKESEAPLKIVAKKSSSKKINHTTAPPPHSIN